MTHKTWPIALLLITNLAADAQAAVPAGADAQVSPAATTRCAEGLSISMALAKSTVLVGENTELIVALRNCSSLSAKVSPLQAFAFLTVFLRKEGVVFPPQVRVQLAFLEDDVELERGESISRTYDLSTWFPLGASAGTYEVVAEYVPDRNDRHFLLRSDPVRLTVRKGTPEHQALHKEFIDLLRHPDTESQKFLMEHPNSLFESRVRLHWASGLDLRKDVDAIQQILGDAFKQSNPTHPERRYALHIRVQSLKSVGRIQEVVGLLEGAQGDWERLDLDLLRRQLVISASQPAGSSPVSEPTSIHP
jgi:hypothetical protein